MSNSFRDLPPYVLNRKRIRRTADGKYRYSYPSDNGVVVVDVSEDIFLELAELDRLEYNNDRKEYRHRGEAPTYSDDFEYEQTNGLENLADEQSYGIQDEICERIDREVVLAELSELDRKIYHLCIEKDFTQQNVAETLGINQSTVTRKLASIYDLVETERLNDGTRTKEEIKFELLWSELLQTGKTKQDDDVILEEIIFSFHQDDLWLFLNWFYSFKEMCRYIVKYLILREKYAQQDVDNFLNTAPDTVKNYFNKYYANQPQLIQCVYVNMFNEAWRRIQISQNIPIGSSYFAIDKQRDRIVKRLKTTENEFLRDRFLPFLANKRQARQKEFIKKYKH